MKKGMKQTKIGWIPEDWEVTSIGDISDFDCENLTSNTSQNYEFKYISLECVDKGKLTNFQEIKFRDAPSRARRILRKGDLLFSTVRPNLKSHLFFESDLSDFICSTGFAVVRSKLCAKYIFYNFFSNELNRQVENLIVGSNYPAINSKDVRNLKIPLPSLPEQHAIAKGLSDADAWIESLETLLQKKRNLKQGAMQELLRPKDGWTQERLGNVISVYRGGSPRPIQNFISNDLNGVDWIKIGDTNSSAKYIIDSTEKIIPLGVRYSRKVFVGDFLLSNSMSFGRPYILKIEGCIHDGWLVLQNYHAKFDTEFLYYLLSSDFVIDQYRSKAAGSSVLNLNKELVSSVVLPFPSKEGQTRIATILSDMDAEIETLEQKLTKARQIKQGMMQQLLTGQIRLVKSPDSASVETLQKTTA